MKPISLRRISSVAVGATLATAAVFFSSGCGNLFVPKHRVLVDAISAPDAVKPTGQSYRLLAKRSTVSQGAAQIPVVKACLDAALTRRGMFEPPPNSAPDIFIEVTYGRDTAPQIEAESRETFLQLSARSNPTRALDRPGGPELWDVKVAVLGLAGPTESAMPLLASVAADYLATDTGKETKVQVPRNSPEVETVRKTALKALEGNSPPQTVSAAPPGGTPSRSGSNPGPAAAPPQR